MQHCFEQRFDTQKFFPSRFRHIINQTDNMMGLLSLFSLLDAERCVLWVPQWLISQQKHNVVQFTYYSRLFVGFTQAIFSCHKNRTIFPLLNPHNCSSCGTSGVFKDLFFLFLPLPYSSKIFYSWEVYFLCYVLLKNYAYV